MIIIFVPISILLAIAASPESLQILTANSDKNAIPVIFINKLKNVLLTDVLFANDCNRFIIPLSLSKIKAKISTPVSRLMYIANSGLYCFNNMMIIKAISPNPNYFYNFHRYSFQLKNLQVEYSSYCIK